MRFERLDRAALPALLPFFRAQTARMSNYSAGVFFMWARYMDTHYAIEEDCLLLRDKYVGKHYFYYPLSRTGDADAERRALDAIERHCRETGTRLHFTCVPREKASELFLRYGDELHVSNIRRWRDYLYEAESFRAYAGGRYSGQRNHVNKFRKNNPDWSFAPLSEANLADVAAFLDEIEAQQAEKGSSLADEEMRGVRDILPRLGELGIVCGVLRAGGRIVALSAGEVCGDTMIVHIEKALRGVQGAYPAVAQQFALAFCGGVRYINREDDAGDAGLRKSKLQYLPVRLLDKYNVVAHRPIDALSHLPEWQTPRLVLRAIADEDAHDFALLARDDALNRYWGYDWRVNAKTDSPDDMWFLEDVRKDFARKEEIPLGVYFEGKLVGEVVLHNFGYRAEAEIGMRILPAWQGRGFAREALIGLAEYGFVRLGLERIEAKCFRENTVSAYTLRAAGMRPCGEDETYFYFYKTAAM